MDPLHMQLLAIQTTTNRFTQKPLSPYKNDRFGLHSVKFCAQVCLCSFGAVMSRLIVKTAIDGSKTAYLLSEFDRLWLSLILVWYPKYSFYIFISSICFHKRVDYIRMICITFMLELKAQVRKLLFINLALPLGGAAWSQVDQGERHGSHK